jgi:hypothetical protein
MPFKFNPFTGTFDQTGSSGGAAYIDGEVAVYADLSLSSVTAPLDSAWLVRAASGVWPVSRKQAGIYIRTATAGSSRDTDYTYAGTMPDVFSDAVLTIYDDASTTRTGQFNLGSVTAGQNRVLTWPDASGTLVLGNDARIATIGSGTIDTVQTGGGSGTAGNINTSTAGDGVGGYIATSAINADGGYIDTHGENSAAGGNINTSNGGGSIDTRGTGSIGLGVTGTRTTLVGSADTTDKTITLPNATGTVALTQQATDYEVTDSSAGIIMKSPNNSRWRITVDNNGVLLRTALALIFSLSFMCGAKAQVRDLVYGTNNVVVGPTNTNALAFTNSVAFSNPMTFGTNAATTRTNLGVTVASNLPAPWSGAATTNSLLVANGTGGSTFVSTLPSLSISSGSFLVVSNGGMMAGASAFAVNGSSGYAGLWSGGQFGWSSVGSVTTNITLDTVLLRDSANTLASRNGTNAQTYNSYGSYTSSTNYRRLSVGMSNSGIAFIRPEQAGPLTNASNCIYISGLPTNSAGLPSGVLYNLGGAVMVTP